MSRQSKFFAILILFFALGSQTYAFDPSQPIPNLICKSSLTDLEENSARCFYVNFLDYQRVIQGYSDFTYRPNEVVTRDQFAKYITQAFGIDIDISDMKTEDKFPDVPQDNKFIDNIHRLKKAGIIHGYTDGTYRPTTPVGRDQAIKFVVNAAKYKKSDLFKLESDFTYTDIPTDNKFRPEIKKAYKASIGIDPYDQIIATPASNDPDKKFRPSDHITRGELAQIIANAMQYGKFEPASKMVPLTQAISGINPDKEILNGDFKISRYDRLNTTIISSDNKIGYSFTHYNVPTLRQQAENLDLPYATNASFFGWEPRDFRLNEIYDPNLQYVRVIDTGSTLRVREYPNTSSQILAEIPDGTIVQKLDENSEWYKIKFDNITGWIAKTYSQPVDLNETITLTYYQPAGLLNFYGEAKRPIDTQAKDTQLSHIVRYNKNTNKIQLVHRDTYPVSNTPDPSYLDFQTGPLFVENKKLQNEYVLKSLNGRSKHMRTALAISKDGLRKHLIITRNEVSLLEFGHLLLYTKTFKNETNVSIVGLDGGSSTQMYSQTHPEYNFRQEVPKPVIIGFEE